MKQNKETLKQFFETGDKPTQQQYANLIDSYVDAKQPEGEANRRFVIDETGEVSVASEQQVPEYSLSPISGTNTVDLLKDGVSVSQIDLTPYLDNTNLARLVSGTVDANGLATFTRDDSTTFTIDLSNLKDNLTLQEVTDNGNTTTNPIVFDRNLGVEPDAITINGSLGKSIGISSSRVNFGIFQTGLRYIIGATSPQNIVRMVNNSTQLNMRAQESPTESGAFFNTRVSGNDPILDEDFVTLDYFNNNQNNGGSTNLTYTPSATQGTVESDSGTNAVIPAADATNAGLMKANFYEEGTFTPTLNTSGATYATGSETGHYVRVGNLVYYHINIFINGDTIGTPTSSLFIDGLPFVNNAFPTPGTVGNFSASDVSESRLSKLSSVVIGNNNKIYFQVLDESNLLSNVTFTGNGTVRVKGTYKTNIYIP
ncbi:MAG: hypothetical protein HWD89_04340 [Tenacibaculum sp.]|uniref:hypothetical protein n=1 Tax=Tenacibaculum sp. TaxID=1906242 RepID=UPI0018393318|nr:hypothetical protein [Tenacibaculum sp.]NVK08256.1 hypothetical protein [Tenacibaculum sp.]